MTESTTSPGSLDLPEIRTIEVADLSAAMRAGWDDLRACPTYGLTIGIGCALAGLVLVWLCIGSGRLALAFPLVAGFALFSPFLAVTLYEVSRLRERGEEVSRAALRAATRRASARDVIALGFVLGFILFVWLRIALIIYALFFGLAPVNFTAMLTEIFSTGRGFTFFLIGNGVGALFALLTFSITVVSFPLLIDRDAHVVPSILTSLEAVRRNWRLMLGWAAFIGFAMAVATLPAFLGLVIVMPVLGHATWHLYRKLVV